MPSLPWDYFHSELYNVAISQRSKLGQSQALGSGSFRKLFISNGYCRRYHSTGQCSFGGACKYSHSCVRAKEIILPPRAIRNPGLERAPGAVGGNHQATVGTMGVSGQVPNPTRLPTPVQPDKLASLLIGYNQCITDYLLTGFLEGFKVGFSGECTAQCPRNLLSTIQLPHLVSVKLQKEMDLGRISGPWPTPPFPNLVISPVGLVPKKLPGAFRLIHHLHTHKAHLSTPVSPPDFTSVHYASVDDAMATIKRPGPGCFLAKTDIKSAFRIIPLYQSDYLLFGIKWKNQYYFDKCLPMGCASSCRIFEA